MPHLTLPAGASIQAALDAADPGHVRIDLAEGVYAPFQIDRPCSISCPVRGGAVIRADQFGRHAVTIHGQRLGRPVGPLVLDGKRHYGSFLDGFAHRFTPGAGRWSDGWAGVRTLEIEWSGNLSAGNKFGVWEAFGFNAGPDATPGPWLVRGRPEVQCWEILLAGDNGLTVPVRFPAGDTFGRDATVRVGFDFARAEAAAFLNGHEVGGPAGRVPPGFRLAPHTHAPFSIGGANGRLGRVGVVRGRLDSLTVRVGPDGWHDVVKVVGPADWPGYLTFSAWSDLYEFNELADPVRGVYLSGLRIEGGNVGCGVAVLHALDVEIDACELSGGVPLALVPSVTAYEVCVTRSRLQGEVMCWNQHEGSLRFDSRCRFGTGGSARYVGRSHAGDYRGDGMIDEPPAGPYAAYFSAGGTGNQVVWAASINAENGSAGRVAALFAEAPGAGRLSVVAGPCGIGAFPRAVERGRGSARIDVDERGVQSIFVAKVEAGAVQ